MKTFANAHYHAQIEFIFFISWLATMAADISDDECLSSPFDRHEFFAQVDTLGWQICAETGTYGSELGRNKLNPYLNFVVLLLSCSFLNQIIRRFIIQQILR